jgi:putative ABC transport system permease protein
MEARLSDAVSQPRFRTTLFSAFAGLALVMAVVGLYAVLANTVAERRWEIGVRMALGAQRHDVLGLIVWQGMRIAFIGIGIGLAGALAFSHVLRSLLFEIKPNDPLTFALIPVILISTALFACWLPARRATKVDPMEALRYE